VDGTGWFEGREPVPHLAQLRDAVWQDQRVRLAYRDVEGAASTREVEPYGLVIKAERWYLVAGTARGTRVFRGARIDTVERLDERFTRPPGFDLPAFWREWRERFARERPRFLTTLRLTAAGEDALRAIRPAAEHAAWIETPWAPDGTKTVTVDFEREAIALAQLVTIGPGVEVLSPDALRSRLGTLARELTALYDRQPR
jgi:predicted DNA-binding transcriptional regulator YafY